MAPGASPPIPPPSLLRTLPGRVAAPRCSPRPLRRPGSRRAGRRRPPQAARRPEHRTRTRAGCRINYRLVAWVSARRTGVRAPGAAVGRGSHPVLLALFPLALSGSSGPGAAFLDRGGGGRDGTVVHFVVSDRDSHPSELRPPPGLNFLVPAHGHYDAPSSPWRQGVCFQTGVTLRKVAAQERRRLKRPPLRARRRLDLRRRSRGPGRHRRTGCGRPRPPWDSWPWHR